MKHFIFIFTLFSISLSYSQDRFTSNHFLYNSGLTYKAESFEESMYIPMRYKQRADENYEKLRKLRNELNTIKDGIKFNKEKYYPSIDEVNNILYKFLTGNNNLAHPDIDKAIKMTSLFIDETITKYNEDVRKYNESQKYNY